MKPGDDHTLRPLPRHPENALFALLVTDDKAGNMDNDPYEHKDTHDKMAIPRRIC